MNEMPYTIDHCPRCGGEKWASLIPGAGPQVCHVCQATQWQAHGDEAGPWAATWTLCVRCEHRWMAVFPVAATVLECPSCGVFAGIPDDPNAEEHADG